MPSKKNKKIKLGKRTNKGYEYKTKINFGEDLSTQIFRVIREKEINEVIKEKVKELREATKRVVEKEKNLQYYYEMGKRLSFLDTDLFENIAPNSVFRRIVEELPELLPDLDMKNKESKKNACRHVSVMYELAHARKSELSKASWDQWYEIGKFPGICKDKNLLRQILIECKNKRLSGIPLRNRIKEIRQSKGGQ